MTMTMAMATTASSLLHSKPPPPPPLTLLSLSPQLAQHLHLPKSTSFKWTPLVITPSHSTLKKTMPTTRFNVQINVKDNEPEESLLLRFKKAVIRARVLQECKRRRFFESTQDKKKRKTRDAARRNSKRSRSELLRTAKILTGRPQPRTPVKKEAPKKKEVEDDDDNWELPEGEIPYC